MFFQSSFKYKPHCKTTVSLAACLDRFQIKKIYADAPNAQKWELSDDPNNDNQFDPQSHIAKNQDGSFKIKDDKVRMGVHTIGYDLSKCTKDQSKALEQGYMMSKDDWKNFEAGGYFRVNKKGDDQVTIYGRGATHHGSGKTFKVEGCLGSAYKPRIFYAEGKSDICKEVWHVNYFFTDQKDQDFGNLIDKWFGFKMVVYNINNDTAVKVETWFDKECNNNWLKIDEMTDTGEAIFKNKHDRIKSSGAKKCKCKKDEQPILWGGPEVVFRWDDTPDVDFKFLSVREITPQLCV
jgi:hypothetical protein